MRIDLGAEKVVHAVQVNLADHELAAMAPAVPDAQQKDHEVRGIYTGLPDAQYLLEVSADGLEWTAIADTRLAGIDAPHGTFVLDEPARVRHVRLTGFEQPFGAPLTVSGLRVFGDGGGDAPATATPSVERTDDLTAQLAWEAVEGAQGYNVRYGSHPQKLYHSWLVYDQTELTVRALNAGVDYWFAVDAFNDSGVTPGEVVAAH